MAKTILALFKKQKNAERAVKKLGEMGFTSDELVLVTKVEDMPAAMPADVELFRDGVRGGGALVIAEAEEVQAYTVAEFLEDEGANVEERDLEVERVVASAPLEPSAVPTTAPAPAANTTTGAVGEGIGSGGLANAGGIDLGGAGSTVASVKGQFRRARIYELGHPETPREPEVEAEPVGAGTASRERDRKG